MFKCAFCVFAAAAAIVSPVAATTVIANFGGTAANAASFNYIRPMLTITAQARSFSVLPSALTRLSQLSATAMQVRRTTPGIGVLGGASPEQIDTNEAGRREGLLLTGSQDFSIRGLRLSFVDNDDTLQLYGVAGTSLVPLGFPGVIRAGLGRPNSGLSRLSGQATGPAFAGTVNAGTQQLTLVTPTRYFTGFFFTTREPGNLAYLGTLGQGYRIDAITAGVPESATWAMLIAGLGVVGAANRRRRISVAA